MKPKHESRKTHHSRIFSIARAAKSRKQAASFKSALVFLLKFNLFSIPLYAMILTGYQSGFLMDVSTGITVSLLRATGIETTVHNGIISVPVKDGNFGAFVSWDSTGWKSMLALFALIFATQFPLRKKIIGLAMIPVVYAVNILRIWFMFFIATVDTGYFALAHITIWSWGLIFAVLGLWILWMKKFQRFDS